MTPLPNRAEASVVACVHGVAIDGFCGKCSGNDDDNSLEPSMKTALPKIPDMLPGTAFRGGFYAGHYFIGTEPRVLIVATKAHEIEAPWSDSTKAVKGALSIVDGRANTDAMAKAGSALAKTIRGLRLGSFDDWYLPSRMESLLAFAVLLEVKAFGRKGKEAFELAWYWTSTQSASHSGYAWYQDFDDGSQDDDRKSSRFLARPVRSIPL